MESVSPQTDTSSQKWQEKAFKITKTPEKFVSEAVYESNDSQKKQKLIEDKDCKPSFSIIRQKSKLFRTKKVKEKSKDYKT